MLIVLILACSAAISLYLWHVNRAISTTPEEAAKLRQKLWTSEQIKEAYEKAQVSPTDVTPYLFSKKQRRYIIVGGSGLVGGWIVQHLIARGELPDAIRIVDMMPLTGEDTVGKVDYVNADVTDASTVEAAFAKSWEKSAAALPLTVFHCVAYINSRDRHPAMLPKYIQVNTKGTETVLKTAREHDASCFIATSSAAVGLRVPSFFPYPWQRWPKDIFQFLPNAEVSTYDAPLDKCCCCYAWAKLKAEEMVLNANSPAFQTGTIRPGHGIYGHGVKNTSSLTYDYLRRGGSPSWMPNVTSNFANAQNVSIGHLAYEDALLSKGHPGGKGYLVTDPNPPLSFAHVYKILQTLAHPSTPMKFPYVPFVLMLLPAYPIEQYVLLRHRWLPWLPGLPDDLTYLQPANFNLCIHIVYTDTAAQQEINYKAPIQSLEGFALAVLDWNRDVDRKIESQNH